MYNTHGGNKVNVGCVLVGRGDRLVATRIGVAGCGGEVLKKVMGKDEEVILTLTF